MLGAPGMHAILFGFKRAFQSTLRLMRPIITSLGLTAARFDLLKALDESYRDSMRQSDLRRKLGVSAPTVSRMLRSLEELGLVARAVERTDTRQRTVSLTALGLKTLRRAMAEIIGTDLLHFAFDCVLEAEPPGGESFRFVRMSELEDSLCAVRSGFGDTGRVSYPWHPDD